jgi:poly-gamma-glutamate capsule biosynthesis protein CapA/YwtB (metallophosphatase superfamily)
MEFDSGSSALLSSASAFNSAEVAWTSRGVKNNAAKMNIARKICGKISLVLNLVDIKNIITQMERGLNEAQEYQRFERSDR